MKKKRILSLSLEKKPLRSARDCPLRQSRVLVEKSGTKCRQIILVGERMKAIVAKNVFYADSLPEGLSKASEFAGKDDIILSSVKCFR